MAMGAGLEMDEFHKWMGYCISAWAQIEEHLFNVCWKCLGSPQKEPAAIVYYRTPGVNARLGLIDELVKSALPKPERKSGGHQHADVARWELIEEKIRFELAIRRKKNCPSACPHE